MRKRVWAVLLAVCLIVGLLPTVAFAGGEEVFVVCVYDQDHLPSGYSVKNPHKGETFGLLQVLDKIAEYEASTVGRNYRVVIESDENYPIGNPDGSFCWPEEVATVEIPNSLRLWLSGTWTIPENITLSMGWGSIIPVEGYLDDQQGSTVIEPQQIDLRGTVNKPSALQCDVILRASAKLPLQDARDELAIPEGTKWTLDNATITNPVSVRGELTGTGILSRTVHVNGADAKLSGQLTLPAGGEQPNTNYLQVSEGASVELEKAQELSLEILIGENSTLRLSTDMTLSNILSVGAGSTLTVAAGKKLTVTAPGENPNSRMISLQTSQDNTSNAQLLLEEGSELSMVYPGTIHGGTQTGPEIAAPNRRYIAGSGTLRFTHPTELQNMTSDDYATNYMLLTWSFGYAAKHREECANSIETSVKIDYSWDCVGTNHNWIELRTQEPSCGSEGYKYSFCPGCGENKRERIEPTGQHNFSDTPGADGKYHCVNQYCNAVSDTPGESPNPTSYSVTVPQAANGTVTVNPVSATAGDIVTITVVPDAGYQAGTPVVTGASGSVDVHKVNDTAYTFTMPGEAVTVSVSFESGVSLVYTPYAQMSSADKGQYYGGKLVITGLTVGAKYVVTFDNGLVSNGVIPRLVHVVTADGSGNAALSCQDSVNVMVFRVTGNDVNQDLAPLYNKNNAGVPVSSLTSGS